MTAIPRESVQNRFPGMRKHEMNEQLKMLRIFSWQVSQGNQFRILDLLEKFGKQIYDAWRRDLKAYEI